LKLQLVVKRAPVTSANDWLKQAWQIFRVNPGLFIGINTFITVIGFVSMVPIVGILVLFVMPFLQAGFYSVIVAAQQQKPLQFDMLFKPFQIVELRAPMIKMAAAQLLCTLPALYFLEQLGTNIKAGQIELAPLLLVVTLYMLSAMLFAYAVPIIYFLRENRLLPVIQASVTACWRNVLPLTLFAFLIVSLVFAGLIILLLVGALSQQLGQILIVPMLLILMPIITIAVFLSFSEFFALVISKEPPTEVFEV